MNFGQTVSRFARGVKLMAHTFSEIFDICENISLTGYKSSRLEEKRYICYLHHVYLSSKHFNREFRRLDICCITTSEPLLLTTVSLEWQ